MGKGKLDRTPSNSSRRRRTARRRAKEKHLSIHPANRLPLNIGCSEDEISPNMTGKDYVLKAGTVIAVILMFGGLLVAYHST